MAAHERLICAAAMLVDGGPGVRFELDVAGTREPGFAVRHEGVVHAYLNRCAHVGVELDWQAGEFFDPETGLLMCATHGALYEPATGECRGGPCRGGRLIKLAVTERDGQIYLQQAFGDQ